MYDLQCNNCGAVKKDCLLSLSEVTGVDQNKLDLKNVKCTVCSGTNYKRLVSAHSATPTNWSSWQRKS
jgi:hypothetical protein